MFDSLTTTRAALERLASAFEPGTLTGEQAVRVVAELGAIRRLTDGMLGRAAKRVDETSAHAAAGGAGAAHPLERAPGDPRPDARPRHAPAKRIGAET